MDRTNLIQKSSLLEQLGLVAMTRSLVDGGFSAGEAKGEIHKYGVTKEPISRHSGKDSSSGPFGCGHWRP